MKAYDKQGISVIICCYNSSARLPQTLLYLSQQNLKIEREVEIIIVDNASTDGTAFTVQKEWSKFNAIFALRIVTETSSGLIYARKRGVEEAKYEYLIFCDDDNWLENNYLEIAYQSIHEKTNIGAVGGFGIGVTDIEFPDWFAKHQDAYAVGKQDVTDHQLLKASYLWGAGLVTRKSLFLKAYAMTPPLLIGRQGNKLSSGEDAEFTMRLQLLGFDLIYNDKLIYKHYICPNRLTECYRARLFSEGSNSSSDIIGYYQQMLSIDKLTKLARLKLITNTLFRCLLLPIVSKKHWSFNHESLTLYFLTGLKIKNMSTEERTIRNLYVNK